ncbi:hypothetical protein V8C86DRAFT_1402473 [Haematococcus lacustris]
MARPILTAAFKVICNGFIGCWGSGWISAVLGRGIAFNNLWLAQTWSTKHDWTHLYLVYSKTTMAHPAQCACPGLCLNAWIELHKHGYE